MDDARKTKKQLIDELKKLRRKVSCLEKLKVKDRKEEEAFSESEEKYRTTFESTGTATVIIEEDTTLSTVNSEFERLCGYSRDKIEGKKSWTEFVVKEDLERMKEYHRLRRIEEVSAPTNYEFRFIDRHGNIKEIFLTIAMIPGTKKSVASLLDITERKQAEEALRIKDSAIRSSINAIAIANLKGDLTYVNDSFLKLWGYDDVKEVLGKPAVAFWQMEESALQVVEALREEGGWFGELIAKRKDGSMVDVQLSGNMVTDDTGKPICMMASFIDITERKRAEEALRESEESYRSLQANIPVGIFRTTADPEGHLLSVNPALAKMFGYDKPEAMSETRVADLYLNHDDRKKFMEAVSSGGAISNYEVQFKRKDGTPFWGSLNARAIIDGSGKVAYFDGVLEDITEHKRAEEALRESEEKYKYLYQETSIANLTIGIDGQIIDANESFAKKMGYEKDEFVGKHALEFVVPEHREKVKEHLERDFRGEYTPETDFDICAKDGSIHTILFTPGGVILYEGDEPYGVLVSGIDITERKRTEEIQSVLFNISQAVSASSNLEELLEIIHQQLGRLIDTTNFYVALYDEENDSYSFPYHIDKCEQAGDHTPQQLRKSLTDYVRKTGKPLLVDEEVHRQLVQKGEVELVGAPSPIWLGVPLKTPQKVIGVVVVQSYEESSLYSAKDLELMSFVSENIAFSIERKRGEEALHESEERYRAFTEEAMVGVYIYRDNRFLFVNKEMEKITGYSRDELLKIDTSKLIFPEDLPAKISRDKSRKRGEDVPPQYTMRIIHKSGETKVLEVRTHPISYISEEAYLGNCTDITERRRVEEELRESEERFQQVVENANEWIWEVDANGLYTYSSPMVKRILGYKPEEIVGKKHFYDLFHPEEREELKRTAFEVFAKKQPFREFTNRNVHKNGKTVWLATSGVPILDKEDNLLGYRGADTDITERKRAEEERDIRRRELEALYSLNRFLISTLDLKEILTQSLKLALKSTELDAAALYLLEKDDSLRLVASEGFSDEFMSSVERLEKGEGYTGKAAEQNVMQVVSIDDYPSSRLKDLLIDQSMSILVCVPLTSKEKPLGVINLISKEAKSLEHWKQDLIQSFGHQISMALENALYFSDLNEYSKALESLLKERSEFFSMASHELRTPITVVNGYLDIMERNLENMDNAQIHETLKKVMEHSERLTLLVETLLDISKIEDPKSILSSEVCEIKPIVKRALNLCEHQAQEKQITCHFEGFDCGDRKPCVIGDALAIENVLLNILGNAIKYSNEGSEVIIRCDTEDDTLRLDCIDQGIGLPPGVEERIFEEFYRVEQGGELKKSGTGLGLSIAKRLVERMGGRIWAHSEGLNEGTTVSFTLPLAKSENLAEKE